MNLLMISSRFIAGMHTEMMDFAPFISTSRATMITVSS